MVKLKIMFLFTFIYKNIFFNFAACKQRLYDKEEPSVIHKYYNISMLMIFAKIMTTKLSKNGFTLKNYLKIV